MPRTPIPSPLQPDAYKEHPSFPEPAGKPDSTYPTPGDDLAALDYRNQPSATAEGSPGLTADRDQPDSGGTPVGPMPDRTILTYDLPTQPRSYDRMGEP